MTLERYGLGRMQRLWPLREADIWALILAGAIAVAMIAGLMVSNRALEPMLK